MDVTIMFGPLKFSLWATIDYHGPSMHSIYYTASIDCCKITFYCNDTNITEFEIIDSKTPSRRSFAINDFELCHTLGID